MKYSILYTFHALILLVIWPSYCCATAQNRTIDDTSGDSVTGALPFYEASDAEQWLLQPGCSDCKFIDVDSSQAFHGTWHENDLFPQDSPPGYVNFTFDGSAVWVFNILPNAMGTEEGFTTNLQFYLDGEADGGFTYSPDGTAEYLYNQVVYHREVENGVHSVEMTVSPDALYPVILFDYAVYTHETPNVTISASSTRAFTTSTSSTTSASSSTMTSQQNSTAQSTATTSSASSAGGNVSTASEVPASTTTGTAALSSYTTTIALSSTPPSSTSLNTTARGTNRITSLGLEIGLAIAAFSLTCVLGRLAWVLNLRRLGRHHSIMMQPRRLASTINVDLATPRADSPIDRECAAEALNVEAEAARPSQLQEMKIRRASTVLVADVHARRNSVRSAPGTFERRYWPERLAPFRLARMRHSFNDKVARDNPPLIHTVVSDLGSADPGVALETEENPLDLEADASLRVAESMQRRITLLEADLLHLREQHAQGQGDLPLASREPLPLYRDPIEDAGSPRPYRSSPFKF